MLKMSSSQIGELSRFAYLADKEIRSDLILGFIKNENDYTSNFTGNLRRIINSHSRTGLSATSLLLGSSEEQRLCCDATIPIQSNGNIKVVIFKAKWPRLASPGYRWDYPKTATGISHFSDQLDRQSKKIGMLAIFV